MTWKLSPGVGFCQVGDDLVFLDLQRDRYFRLAGRDRLMFDAAGEAALDDPAALTRLQAAGLVTASDAMDRIEPAFADVPDRDIHMLSPVQPSLSGVVQALGGLLWAQRAVASRRIAQTIAAIGRRKTAIGPGGAQISSTQIALHFEASRAFAPIARRCLIDSLALMRLCLARGASPTLVFGVKTDPFAAHCWLQHEGRILTCASDDALGFTPILVV